MLAVPLAEAEVRPLLDERPGARRHQRPALLRRRRPRGGGRGAGGAARRRAGWPAAAAHHPRLPLADDGPAVEALTELAGTVRAGAPQIPYLSNVTGTWITAAEAPIPATGRATWCQPVRFAEGVGRAAARSRPGDRWRSGRAATLSTLVRQHPEAAAPAGRGGDAAAGQRGGPDLALLLDALGRLWVAGVPFDSEALFAGERRRRVRLPTYPFERQRYWIDPPRGGTTAETGSPRPRPAPAPTSRTGSGRRSGSRRRWPRPPPPRGRAPG